MSNRYDVLVIGAGPAGYVATIRAAQLGFNVACAEFETYSDPQKEVRLGGTCLNVGCIPSKALLHSSELYENAHHSFMMHGISCSDLKLDIPLMLNRKENIVSQLTKGIRGLFKKNKIALLSGRAVIRSQEEEQWQIDILSMDNKLNETVYAKNVIIASGSSARSLPNVQIDNKLVCDNIGALSFEELPKRLGIIGSGVIGLELGSVWKRLGSKVTVFESMKDFLPSADKGVSKEAWKLLVQQQKLEVHLGTVVKKVDAKNNEVVVTYENELGEQSKTKFDKLIVAIGRMPNTANLGCEEIGLQLDEAHRIDVDEYCQTNLKGIWAVGDVVRGPMLAHKGMEEGIMVAERIAGQAGHVNYGCIPWVIYTHPEIAWVGKTEDQLTTEGVAYQVGQIPYFSNGRALGQGDTNGFVKVIADAQTDEVLGVHIIGQNASELIGQAVTAMEFGASSEDIARICFAHPTLSEATHEAALAIHKRAIHI